MSASISVSCNSIVRQRSPFPRRSRCRRMRSAAAEGAGSVVGGIVVIWLGAIGDVLELPASGRFGFVGNHAARANFSSIGKQSAAILNSSGKVAYRSATNVVAVARRKSSFFSSARQRRSDSPALPAGDAGLSSLERKIAADTLASRALFLRRSHVLRLLPNSLHCGVLDSELASYSSIANWPRIRCAVVSPQRGACALGRGGPAASVAPCGHACRRRCCRWWGGAAPAAARR